jgi:hypothetical protein
VERHHFQAWNIMKLFLARSLPAVRLFCALAHLLSSKTTQQKAHEAADEESEVGGG